MARMYNLGYDWSFDMFAEDAKLYNATPMKGVYPRRDASEREKFMTWLKGCVRDFTIEWKKNHNSLYDRYEGWIGDAFARMLSDMCFSDYYKDTYNQRPHLDSWYYVHMLGLHQTGDVAMTFCSEPIEDAIDMAKRNRDYLMAV